MGRKGNKRPFNDNFLRKLPAPSPGQRVEIGDDKTPGLYARVTAGQDGKPVIAWCVRYTPKGTRQRRETIGIYGPKAMTLAQARSRTLRIVAAAHEGIDLPRKELNAQRADEARSHTVADLIADYVRDYIKPNRRRAKWVERLFELHVTPAIGSKTLAEIERAHIVEMLDRLQNSRGFRAQVNRIRTLVVAMFGWAVERGRLKYNPASGIKRRKQLEKPRERILSDMELRAIWRAAGELPYPGGPFIQSLMLLGFRRDEARAARWSEIDLENKLWRLPAARNKSKRDFEMPLPPTMVELLKELPERTPCVFSANGKRPFTNIVGLKKKLDEKTGITGWTLHDIRRSFRTGLAACGVSEEIAERLLNHAQDTLVKTYNRHRYSEEMRAAIEKWDERLSLIVSEGRDAPNVRELRPSA